MYYKLSLLLVLTLEVFGFFTVRPDSNVKENKQFTQLKKYLDSYIEIKNKGGWQSIKEGNVLRLGVTDPRVIDLKNRLFITHELIKTGESVSDTFDLNLETAIKAFQKNHGIPVSGVADTKTIRELNAPVGKRIQQIELNLKRWKDYPAEFEQCYVFVNIAAGNLDLMIQDSAVFTMKVIVGRPYRKTPVFDADMTYLEFNPYWVVPPGIMKRDILPKLKSNPSYLRSNHMQVFYNHKKIDPSTIQWKSVDAGNCPYTVVQNPGPENPMGVVKFAFPNKYYVYMHDTPSRNLFESPSNTFSSGCIRLSKATELANYILSYDRPWDTTKTDSLIGTTKNTKIYLKKPVKVYISYFTAWVNQAGDLQFATDIYKRDHQIQ